METSEKLKNWYSAINITITLHVLTTIHIIISDMAGSQVNYKHNVTTIFPNEG